MNPTNNRPGDKDEQKNNTNDNQTNKPGKTNDNHGKDGKNPNQGTPKKSM